MEKNNFAPVMSKIFIFISFCLFVSGNAFSHPPIESLFRNGSNPDITMNNIEVKFKLGKVSGDELSVNFDKLSDIYGLSTSFFINQDKILFSEALYSNLTFADESMVYFVEKEEFINFYKQKKSVEFPKDFFFAVMSSLVLNKASVMNWYLKNTTENYQENSKIIDEEKSNFYKKHEISLLDQKNNKNDTSAIVSNDGGDSQPLSKMTTRELNRPYYLDTKQVQLIKEDSESYLKVSIDNFSALFSNNTHQLLSAKSIVNNSELEIILKDYLIFNGTHYMPKYILLKFEGKIQYVIEVIELKHSQVSESIFSKKRKQFASDFGNSLKNKSHDISFLF